jgi:dTDP-glucose 4,6-dehydratase
MSNYDLVKIADEEIVINLTRQGIVSGINPRLFSFTGPGVDTPGNFALGSFMYDALKGQAVRVSGSGNSTRSYMSPIDMGIWLLKASIRPATNTLHIGSPHGFKMSEIASIISRTFGNGEVEIASEQSLIPESYVPETAITEKFLEISETVELVQSLTFWRSQLD